MNKTQWIVVLTGVVLFAGLYFGSTNVPPETGELTKARAEIADQGQAAAYLDEAQQAIEASNQLELLVLEDSIRQEEDMTLKLNMLERLSGGYYGSGQPLAAAIIAEDIAQERGTAEAWSIAGTTYLLSIRAMEVEAKRSFAAQQAKVAFENAISLAPQDINHRINLANVYIEKPAQDNPMQGILMLRDLSEQYPGEAPVYSRLATLAIQTGQYQRAVERLEVALELDPDNVRALQLMARAYQGLGNSSKVQEYQAAAAAAAEG